MTQDETTMTTFEEDETMSTGDCATATFDDLPDELRVKIMMMRADRQAWESHVCASPRWESVASLVKNIPKDMWKLVELRDACRARGLTVTGNKSLLRCRLGRHHCEQYLSHVLHCELFWQPWEFRTNNIDDYFNYSLDSWSVNYFKTPLQKQNARAVKAWWNKNRPEFAF